jgi:hypothetical protein
VRVELALFLGILVLMELATQRLSLTKLLITGLLSLLGRGPVFNQTCPMGFLHFTIPCNVVESKLFLLFMVDDRRIRIRICTSD